MGARLSREHNDSNILVLGSAFTNEKLARRILKVWLSAKFQGGRHLRRLNKIKKMEREIRGL
jgi:RpiB/LacA/LacB family sugar-phosphate isomerase